MASVCGVVGSGFNHSRHGLEIGRMWLVCFVVVRPRKLLTTMDNDGREGYINLLNHLGRFAQWPVLWKDKEIKSLKYLTQNIPYSHSV